MSSVLVVRNLKKVYGKKKPFTAVDGISFSLEEGEILGLLGPNGSGKTTTIQMLLGTLSITEGEVLYFGKDFVRHRSEILESVSFASTYTSLPGILTVEENLEVIGRFYGLSPSESERRYDPLLERFGILEKKKKRVGSLSAGQMTRLMLVKAFFTQPKVVLLDEPTASLDPDMAQEICQFLLEQREKNGLSILFTSHKMAEATKLCDRAIFLRDGKIIANDLPMNLAKSTGGFRLRLLIPDGMKRATAIAEERKFSHTVEHRTIEISLDEREISSFLTALGKAEVQYANIRIEEPSLENYFLQISRRKK
ncbi:MAG: ABC transporter ATP-binding protein [Verrucomicrobiota bacterium]|nr:ABC transporter ATP-binding protein [Verrucomicrobiota bacterium]